MSSLREILENLEDEHKVDLSNTEQRDEGSYMGSTVLSTSSVTNVQHLSILPCNASEQLLDIHRDRVHNVC